MKKRYILIPVVAIVVLAVAWGPIASQVEQAKYTVEKTDGMFEIRAYDAQIVAEVTTKGERQPAISQGFRMIADYIFGNNSTKQKEAESPSESIAMTAPVLQQSTKKSDEWNVRFVMPEAYTLSTLPTPNKKEVKLIKIPAKRFVAIRFSGSHTDENMAEHQAQLEAYIKQEKLRTRGKPVFAFYNPPWTLPFLKRNEVMFELR